VTKETQIKRNTIKKHIRNFLEKRGFLQVDTPVLSPSLIPESHIDNFITAWESPYGKDIPLYLTPSPEIFLKRLVARGWGSLYQFTPSFRNKESNSPNHSPEFTMLEWYGVNRDYRQNMDLMELLLQELAHIYTPPWGKKKALKISMREAFLKHTQIDLLKNPSTEDLGQFCVSKGLFRSQSWEENFHTIFLTLVEPEFPTDRPVFLYDYPAAIPTLAKKKEDEPCYERWELYIGGIEIANCYSEETRSSYLWDYFSQEDKAKREKDPRIRSDKDFVEEIGDIMPPNSGVALGFDRLVMVLLDFDNIEGVINFPLSGIIA